MTIRGQRRPHVVPITAPSFPTMPRPPVYRRIAYTFVALTVLFVIAVLWLSSVRAEVVVKVKKNIARMDGVVEVSRAPTSGQIAGRVVQGTYEKIQEFPVPDASTNTTSAVTPLVPTPSPVTPNGVTLLAKGTVKVINNYSKAQTLVKTTRLLTSDGKLYRIDKTIIVPSGGTMLVGVYADKPGEEFAIGPTKFTIPGLYVDLQKHIYAESSEAFKAVPSTEPLPVSSVEEKKPATSVKTGKVLTSAVLDDAHRTLQETVLEQAKRSLQGEVEDEKYSDAVYFVKLVDKKSNVDAGQSTEKFLASVKLDVTAVFYPKEDMQALVRSKLKEKIPDGREFLPFDEQAIQFVLESVDAKKETAVVRVTAEGAYQLTSGSPILQKGLVAGKTREEATQLLKSLGGDIEEVRVTIKPGWLRKIPTLKDHIEMKVE
jgi:hypothetical protein